MQEYGANMGANIEGKYRGEYRGEYRGKYRGEYKWKIKENIKKAILAPYASFADLSKGRIFGDEKKPIFGDKTKPKGSALGHFSSEYVAPRHPTSNASSRSIFERDRDRIYHAHSFRRLAHKTQVFIAHREDLPRTRLTHSLEVAQIARSLARRLRVNEDLAEALSLAHDLGHPPFGHKGEEALDEMMKPYGGFDHNAHTLRIVSFLEKPYGFCDGLNLSWEMMEGLAKHNGPVDIKNAPYATQDIADIWVGKWDLQWESYASLEAQISSVSDDIAYNCHDIDDGVT